MDRPTAPATERRLVLLVEDDEDLRFALSDVLDAEGYQLVVAETGPQALSSSQGKTLYAAVVDLNLPGLAGSRVAEELLKRDPTINVVVMSGEHGAQIPEGARLLPKPFAVDRLLQALRTPQDGRPRAAL